jgi:hypothetical protein
MDAENFQNSRKPRRVYVNLSHEFRVEIFQIEWMHLEYHILVATHERLREDTP